MGAPEYILYYYLDPVGRSEDEGRSDVFKVAPYLVLRVHIELLIIVAIVTVVATMILQRWKLSLR